MGKAHHRGLGKIDIRERSLTAKYAKYAKGGKKKDICFLLSYVSRVSRLNPPAFSPFPICTSVVKPKDASALETSLKKLAFLAPLQGAVNKIERVTGGVAALDPRLFL